MADKKKQINPHTYKFDTLSLHAGYQPHKNAGSRQVPITKQLHIFLMMLIMLLHFLILKEVVIFIAEFQILP